MLCRYGDVSISSEHLLRATLNDVVRRIERCYARDKVRRKVFPIDINELGWRVQREREGGKLRVSL